MVDIADRRVSRPRPPRFSASRWKAESRARTSDGKAGTPAPAVVTILGMTISSMTDELRAQYTIDKDLKGAVITEVAQDGAAADKRLEPGDVLAMDDVRALTRMHVVAVVAEKNDLVAAINRLHRADSELSDRGMAGGFEDETVAGQRRLGGANCCRAGACASITSKSSTRGEIARTRSWRATVSRSVWLCTPGPVTGASSRPMIWIDTHCHLDAPEFDVDRDAVRQQARAAGVALCVLPAVQRSDWAGVQALAQQHGDAYALGIHPLYVPQADEQDLLALDEALTAARDDQRLVAVGEIGLDFFVPALCEPAMRERQWRFYLAQLQLAPYLLSKQD